MTFERINKRVSLLKIPFDGIWAGVYLLHGEDGLALVDSGLNAEWVDNIIVPALGREGFSPADLTCLLCTHTHGDHVGGHARIRELNPRITVCATAEQEEKLADPLAFNILIRKTFPEDSPPPSYGLRGVKTDRILKEGEKICGFRVVLAPGHDSDCICFFNEETRTLLTGDSLQQDGTDQQGAGLYMYLGDYRRTTEKLLSLAPGFIVCGHPFNPLGGYAEGKEKCAEYLKFCRSLTDEYGKIVKELRARGKDMRGIAEGLIAARHGKRPAHLFLSLYTVREHLKELF